MTNTAKTQKLAKRHYCQHFGTSGRHDVGPGKGPRKCRTCGGAIRIMEGVYGVFVWRGDGRYPLADAVKTFTVEAAAERHTTKDERYVVRFVTA